MSSIIQSKAVQQTQNQKPQQKAQRMILSFNKNGLQALTNQKTQSQAFDYFKKAQKTIIEQLKISPDDKKLNQLAAITYNNLACYYKKTGKPKVSLTYLKKALEIQVFKVQNWLSTASTHLNICAIYSYIGKHEEASEHAVLAIKMIEKWENEEMTKKQPEDQIKTYHNVKMLSNYNAAIEYFYLKKHEESLKYYQTTKQIAQKNQQKNAPLIKSCLQGIQKLKEQQGNYKQRLVQILTKRKQHQQRNNYDFMRKNKKNYPKEGQGWRDLIHDRKKYAQYKVETEHQSQSHFNSKKHQSVGKLSSIRPVLHTDDTVKGNLKSNTIKLKKKIKE